VLKIVDVAPIRGSGLFRGFLFNQASDGGRLACPAATEQERVEFLPLDAQSELHGLDRAILSENVAETCQLSGTSKGQLCGVAPLMQNIGRQAFFSAILAIPPFKLPSGLA
jgi:hypothetical protein